MASVDRASLRRMVYDVLAAEPDFRARLTATTPDGRRPITVALREDSVRALLHEVVALGGAANVAVPALNGFIIVAVQSKGTPSGGSTNSALDTDCTVGVLTERITVDGGSASYGFVLDDGGENEYGSAGLVALGSMPRRRMAASSTF